ncbi:MAG: DNA recombination protein RmuC [Rickettsiales bacterium]|jgi:DNA recombination protein RmuC|nr:DNA recombination protein RmuC [Rickettsiales bacterium]
MLMFLQFFVGCFLGIFIGYLLNEIRNVKLRVKVDIFQKDKEDIEAVKKENENLKIELSSIKTLQNKTEEQLQENKKEIERLNGERNNLKIELSKLETLQIAKKEQEEQLKNDFKGISLQVIEENKGKFSDLLEPYCKQMGDLQKDLSSNKDLLNIKVNEINNTTKNFVDAIKINKKIQGNLGEMQLELLLEKFGLKEGINYEKQVNIKNANSERKIPDIIVKLPDNNAVIIDSKVSLNNYIEYNKAEEREQEKTFMENYIRDIKEHIKELANKDYVESFIDNGYNVVGYVLMFLPFEKAFIEAISYDSNIFDVAYQNKIVIVTPSSLMGILGTIEQINKIEKQNKNIKEVFRNVENLCKKVISFEKEVTDVVENIDKARKSWAKAQETYINGKGGIVSIKEKLDKLESRENNSENIEIEE